MSSSHSIQPISTRILLVPDFVLFFFLAGMNNTQHNSGTFENMILNVGDGVANQAMTRCWRLL